MPLMRCKKGKLSGEVTHVRRNCQSKFEVKRSQVKVIGEEKLRAAYRVGHWSCPYASAFK